MSKRLKFHFKNGDWVIIKTTLQEYRKHTDERTLSEKNMIYFDDAAIDPVEVVFIEEIEVYDI